MTAADADRLLGRVMLAFEGDRLPPWVASRLRDAPAAGMTVFRHHNVRSPGQLRELTEAFQREAQARATNAGGGVSQARAQARGGAGAAPLLVAADAEGGQLQALGAGVTQFAGNMALGAVGDEGLAERVGAAIGREARAMGVNVAYAPSLDLADEPANVAMGIRSFGDDPAVVGPLGAAIVRGLQGVGVAASIKHFPGLGSVRQDTHFGLGVIDDDRAALESGAVSPFRAGIAAGARLVMSGHVAVPAFTSDATLPATLSRAVMRGLLRDDLGFIGVTISDALDMEALAQGAGQAEQIVAAVNAGVDLLLCAADRAKLERIEGALTDAAARGLVDLAAAEGSDARIRSLREWLASHGDLPDLSIVACAEHRALSRELARRSMTLVRGEARVAPDARILAVMPEPTDLTPADTSSTVAPGLARALETHFGSVHEVVVDMAPSDAEIAGVRTAAERADVVVVGTIDGFREPAQMRLVEALVGAGRPVIAVAMRTPWDVAVYPEAITAAVCTYSILPDSLEALAAALAGESGFEGRLPVRIGSTMVQA